MPGRAIRNALIERVEKEKEPIKKCYNCLAKCNPVKVPYCITKALIDAVKVMWKWTCILRKQCRTDQSDDECGMS